MRERLLPCSRFIVGCVIFFLPLLRLVFLATHQRHGDESSDHCEDQNDDDSRQSRVEFHLVSDREWEGVVAASISIAVLPFVGVLGEGIVEVDHTVVIIVEVDQIAGSIAVGVYRD